MEAVICNRALPSTAEKWCVDGTPPESLQRIGNPAVNRRGCETLNALFGVAYDRTALAPDPQLGKLLAT